MTLLTQHMVIYYHDSSLLILLYHIEWAIIDWLCLAWQILKLIMGGVNNNHSQGYYNNHCFKFIFIGQGS